MSFRKGIVVETHPEDNSVDLVMVDTAERLVGVKVGAIGASSRTGTVDLPDVAARQNKWDISKRTEQDIEAMVGYMGSQPVVICFVFPHKNQILTKDKKRRIFRHQSDVSNFIDGDGNFQMDWPNGTYVRVGESADREDTAGKNFAGNSAVDRNTGKQYHIRIGLAGGTGVITVSPSGKVKFLLKDDFDVETEGKGNFKSKGDMSFESEANISMKAKGTFSAEAEGNASLKGARVDLN